MNSHFFVKSFTYFGCSLHLLQMQVFSGSLLCLCFQTLIRKQTVTQNYCFGWDCVVQHIVWYPYVQSSLRGSFPLWDISYVLKFEPLSPCQIKMCVAVLLLQSILVIISLDVSYLVFFSSCIKQNCSKYLCFITVLVHIQRYIWFAAAYIIAIKNTFGFM